MLLLRSFRKILFLVALTMSPALLYADSIPYKMCIVNAKLSPIICKILASKNKIDHSGKHFFILFRFV